MTRMQKLWEKRKKLPSPPPVGPYPLEEVQRMQDRAKRINRRAFIS